MQNVGETNHAAHTVILASTGLPTLDSANRATTHLLQNAGNRDSNYMRTHTIADPDTTRIENGSVNPASSHLINDAVNPIPTRLQILDDSRTPHVVNSPATRHLKIGFTNYTTTNIFSPFTTRHTTHIGIDVKHVLKVVSPSIRRMLILMYNM